MIQTAAAILVFTTIGVWYAGRQPRAVSTRSRSLLMTPQLYAGLLAWALLLVFLWR